MSSTIETLTQPVLIAICLFLEPHAMLQFASASRVLWKVVNDQEVWKSKTLIDFGDLFTVHLLFTSAGLEVDSRFATEPSDWAAYYRAKTDAARGQDPDEKLRDAEIDYVRTQALLRGFQESRDLDVLAQVANKMIGMLGEFTRTAFNISSVFTTYLSLVHKPFSFTPQSTSSPNLDTFPAHAGCYHILAFVLFVLNHLEDALLLLEMGRDIDPEYEPIDGVCLR
ncbi:hypothetical protein BC936DRAFT_145218 [Jimgerdemannia flammicorona]|uniref:F-box domain-containing protein n=1 Tax=Jimgerdemannia flammicorona TaxID=994334 RepID=A0A433DNQ4_9FUNG|nr:hypothetical protein BC936DRAFT_145218 [Jimgerdemannia flammicorona]